MVEYRYHRVATNEANWVRPNAGRLGKSDDYLGKNGFGFEDWNFSKEVWEDGNYHLFLQGSPAQKDQAKFFNIALGVHTGIGHLLIGFCKHATFTTSNLADEIWRKRAKHLDLLDQAGSLGGRFKGQPLSKKL